jgi:glycosyltransferase involved in cell wall biosynthesis
MWQNQSVSVIFSTYNEKESIKQCINELFDTGVVDEVIVVNNNASAGTKEEVEKTRAKQVFESKQGYGFGYQRGLSEATGDILIMSEPDGTFSAKDVLKLLVYSEDFDVVFGTRTNHFLIGDGANMGMFLKWGNWFVAKLMEVCFNTTALTDVGCTLRLIKLDSLNKIQHQFTIGKSHFGPEFMILCIINKLSYVEIPINYGKRIGESSVTGSFIKAFKLGLIMIHLILRYRLMLLFKIVPKKKSEAWLD